MRNPAAIARAHWRFGACRLLLWLVIGASFVSETAAIDRDCGGRAGSQCGAAPALFQWSGQPAASECSGDDEDTIVGDRPDFTEALTAVGRGRVQMEIGYLYGQDDDGPTTVRSQAYPLALFRVGLFADWFEFRIASTGLDQTTRDAIGRRNLRGAEDLYLGFKLALTEQHGVAPAMAMIPQMFVPTAGRNFTNDEVLPGLNWIYGWDLTDTWSFGGSTQANRAVDDVGQSFTLFAQSLVTGIALTERFGTYGEWFMFTPHSATADTPTEHYFDGGFTFLVNHDLQLDILAGVGLNDAAEDFFGGGGLAVRY